MRTKAQFPLKPLDRIAKTASGKRVSRPALRALRGAMLDYAEDLARDIVAASTHAERNTVLRKDVDLVRKLHSR